MIDNRTPNLSFPLPHPDNLFKDDVVRLREAITDIDSEFAKKGVANGYAGLDSGGKIPASQLPSFVDDIIEAQNFASLPTTGEQGKIYVTLNDNKQYRWSGSAYVNITSTLTPASPTVLGGVKVGSGLTVGGDGTLSVIGGGSGTGLPVFTEQTITPISNGQTVLTPAGGYVAGQIRLYMNGIKLYGGGDDYTASDGVNINLNFAANTTDTFVLERWEYLPESRALNKAGDTMTGSLGLAGNASSNMEAVPKQQLDAGLATKADNGLLTGSGLTLSATARLAGRASAGGGAIEEIQIGSGLTLAGNTLTASGSSGVSSFNTRSGAVTLTSADVTGALGFTPYNAASIGSASVNYAASAGNANTLQGYGAGSFAPASHTHSYAPMTAVVSISNLNPSSNFAIRCTRADGSFFDITLTNSGGA